jgi:hypothetical protein
MTPLLLIDPADPCCVIKERRRLRTRLSAHLCARNLDRALAAGVSPDSSAALSLRAHALIGSQSRDKLARSIRMLIADARRPLGPLAPGVPVCRPKVLRASGSFDELADRLAREAPVDAGGMAEVALLIAAASGPLFDHPADELEATVRRVMQALEASPSGR